MDTSQYVEFNDIEVIGHIIEERLPNIKGTLGYLISTKHENCSQQFNGALAWAGWNNYAGAIANDSGTGNFDIVFDASQFNSIYKDPDPLVNGTIKLRGISLAAVIKY